MYQHFFGFEATPFTKTIATPDVLATPSLKELIARLNLVVKERGIGLVTGDIGSGKSTAVRAFLASLDPNRHILVQLAAPIASPAALYRSLLLALNQQPPFGATAQIASPQNHPGRSGRYSQNSCHCHRRIPSAAYDPH